MKQVKAWHICLITIVAAVGFPIAAHVDVDALKRELTVYKGVTMRNLTPEARYMIICKIAEYEQKTHSKAFQNLLEFIKNSFWRQWNVPEHIRKERMITAEKIYLDTLYASRSGICPIAVPSDTKEIIDRTQEEIPKPVIDIPLAQGYSIKILHEKRPELFKARHMGTTLDMSNLKINDLEGLRDIPDSANIRKLDLFANRIRSLRSGILHDFTRLEELYLSDNQLTYLDPNALQGLTALQLVDFSNNQLEELPSQLFHDATNLQELYLAGNRLKTFDPYLVPSLSHAKIIDLSNNQISDFDPSILQALTQLQWLNLSHNPLTPETKERIQKALAGKQVVVWLDPEEDATEKAQKEAATEDSKGWYSRLKEKVQSINWKKIGIGTGILAGAAALGIAAYAGKQYWDRPEPIHAEYYQEAADMPPASGNMEDKEFGGQPPPATKLFVGSIRALRPDVLNDRFAGTTLDLSNLYITSLDGLQDIDGIENVQTLDLSHNKLTKVEENSFQGLINLQGLHLSHNQINELKVGAFRGLDNLNSLYLSNNQLIRPDPDVFFSELPSIRWIDLSNNPVWWETKDNLNEIASHSGVLLGF